MSSMPLLSLLVWLPIVGALVVMFAAGRNDNLARMLSLGISVVVFVMSIGLYTGFDASTPLMQFEEIKLH